MSILIDFQIQVFTMSLAVGILLGLVYDGIRIFRRVVKHNIIVISIEDILFWMMAIVILFTFLIYENNGEIRGFIILGIFIGVFIYLKVFSNPIVKIGTKILKTILDMFNKSICGLIKFFENFTKKHLQFNKKRLLYNKDKK